MRRKRTFAKVESFTDSCAPDGSLKDAKPAEEAEANLVSSLLDNGASVLPPKVVMHAPTLDIDFPCELLPSSTEGHFHLLIDKPLTWEQYVVVLQALAFAGIIEDGYFQAAMRQKQTYIRKPGVTK